MSAVIASAAQWQLGLALGIAVVVVAAAIVITIVLLAVRIAKQAKTAEEAVEVVARQTAELGGIAGSTTPACGSCTPPARCERLAVGK